MNAPPDKRRLKLRHYLGIAFVTLLILIGWNWKAALNGIAQSLVYRDELIPAEALVVLSGGGGNRVREAARLYNSGFGSILIMSGTPLYPDVYFHDMMKQYAIKLGIPEKAIHVRRIRNDLSTLGEAGTNLEMLRERGIRSFILVTSEFHTGRARRIYLDYIERENLDMKMQVAAAIDEHVPLSNWWEKRYSRKMVFLEFIKSINSYFEK